MIKIDIDTVTELLTRIARGELSDSRSHDAICMWTIRADGFVIEIFDDDHEVDYVESVTDAKGQTVGYNQYMNAYGANPIDRLTPEIRHRLGLMMFSDLVDKTIGPRGRGKGRRSK